MARLADGFRVERRPTSKVEADIREAIELPRFQQLEQPPKDLRAIRGDPMWLAEPCTFCGHPGRRSVDLEVP